MLSLMVLLATPGTLADAANLGLSIEGLSKVGLRAIGEGRAGNDYA